MTQAYFMGIDTGSNSSKGIIIDEAGNVMAVHQTTHEMTNPKPGHYEHDADKDWWGDFCLISQKLLEISGLKSEQISAVGISALGADCLPVDENCKPLRKAILYGIDSRAVKEIEQLTEIFGEEQINKWYGRPLCSSDIMPKILWVKNNEPDVYAKTYKFITGSTFITAKLTGNYVVDRFLGLASFNPLYDQKTWQPQPELCKYVCRPDQLAEIHEASDLAGYVTDQAAIETGLKEGTPVIVGTDDSGAEAISAGVVDVGKMMIQFGSSVYMILGTEGLVDDERLWREEFIVPGLCDISAGTNTAGSLTKWYRDNFYQIAKQQEAETGIDAYQFMMDGLEELPAGSNNLITLPYFAGERTPINDPQAKGMIIGLDMNHTLKHLYKSALEGIGFSISQQIALMEQHPEVQLDTIYAVGGGAQNDQWMQIVADILGKPLHCPKITIGAAYGDALMAGIGIKHPSYQSFADLTNIIQDGKVFTPNPENHVKYQKLQSIYEQLYELNKEMMHKIDEA